MKGPTKLTKVIKVLRLLLGFIILVFGLNGFISFLPMPEPPAEAAKFLKDMSEAGFVFPLLYGVEIVFGILLLFNLLVPLVLLGFVPIAANILLYHLSLDPAGGAVGYFTVLIEIILLGAYYDHYKFLFKNSGKSTLA